MCTDPDFQNTLQNQVYKLSDKTISTSISVATWRMMPTCTSTSSECIIYQSWQYLLFWDRVADIDVQNQYNHFICKYKLTLQIFGRSPKYEEIIHFYVVLKTVDWKPIFRPKDSDPVTFCFLLTKTGVVT